MCRGSLEELIIPEDFAHMDAPDGPPLHPRFLPMVSNGLARIALHAKAQDMTAATWDVCYSFLRVRPRHREQGALFVVLNKLVSCGLRGLGWACVADL